MNGNLDNLDRNNIHFEYGDLTFRELSEENGKDKDDIVQIIKRCAVFSSAVLYANFFMETDKKIENDMNKDHHTLPYLLSEFKKMKKTLPYSNNPQERAQQFNNIKNHLENPSLVEKLFSTYGPIQQPFEKNTETYIKKAVEARKKKPERELFRLGIDYSNNLNSNNLNNNNLIGCFVFDFIPDAIYDCKATGDIGIFIDTRYRIVKDENGTENRRWHDVMLGGVCLFKKYLPLPNRDEWNISATTHPLNFEARNILCPENGFVFKGKKLSEYNMQERNYYLNKYSDFVDKFSEKVPDNGKEQ
jgi:hypothetical protein